MEKFEGATKFELINANVSQWKYPYETTKLVDMVVMNPPFGTKNEGIDTIFLEKAICILINFKKLIKKEM